MSSENLRWGIMGAARIAGKALVPAFTKAEASVVAVAASSLGRAEAFAKTHGIAKAYEGYQALLDDPSVDAVYLPLANGLHKEWAIKTAEAGKHCLCEKPLVLTASEAEEIRGAFEKSGCVLQEAFMWRHHPQIAWLRERLASGDLGEVLQINAHFSFMLDRDDDYRWIAKQGGGALMDIGCYCINGARLFFEAEPKEVSVRANFRESHDGEGRVDESAAGWLDFGEGRLASFTCSFVAEFSAGLELVCSKSRVWLGQPWLQNRTPLRVVIQQNNERTFQEFEATHSYAAMVENFTKAVREGGELFPGQDGVDQARSMEAAIASSRKGGEIHEVGETKAS